MGHLHVIAIDNYCGEPYSSRKAMHGPLIQLMVILEMEQVQQVIKPLVSGVEGI